MSVCRGLSARKRSADTKNERAKIGLDFEIICKGDIIMEKIKNERNGQALERQFLSQTLKSKDMSNYTKDIPNYTEKLPKLQEVEFYHPHLVNTEVCCREVEKSPKNRAKELPNYVKKFVRKHTAVYCFTTDGTKLNEDKILRKFSTRLVSCNSKVNDFIEPNKMRIPVDLSELFRYFVYDKRRTVEALGRVWKRTRKSLRNGCFNCSA